MFLSEINVDVNYKKNVPCVKHTPIIFCFISNFKKYMYFLQYSGQ